jgi:hypothetical protein
MPLIDLPENISYFQIIQVILDPITLGLQLEIFDPIDHKTVVLEFRNLLYLSISNTPDDDNGDYMIGDIQLRSVSADELNALLATLNYGYLDIDIKDKKEFYHLHEEGCICIDVVSCSYKITINNG